MKKVQRTRRALFCAVVATAMFFMIPTAQADTLTFALSYEFSGATPPVGATPWLTATFDDHDATGSVDLLLETTNLTDDEFVFEWLFNFDSALDPTNLVFSAPTKIGAFLDPVISQSTNTYQANGDGFFDIKVGFSNANGATNRFGVGNAVQYTIELSGLTVDSFDFPSFPDGGQGVYPTAAHVGGINDDYSGWVTIPEPSSMVLLGVASSMIVFVRSRFLI